MKNIFSVILILFVGLQLAAQEEMAKVEDDKIYSFVQEKASPVEGITAFYQSFIDEFQMNISPTKENDAKIKLKFVVEKDGTFGDIKCESTDVDYGKEAIRVLKKMPAWKPAKHNGETVRSSFTIPINIGDKRDKRDKRDKSEKKNKIINDKFDSKIIERIVLDQNIKTDEFEFQCNCSLSKEYKSLKNNLITKVYKLNDYQGMYSISILNNPQKEHVPNFDELLTSKKLNGDKKYIDLNGIKAFQIGNDLESYGKGYGVTIMFLKEKNFVNIQINAQNRVLTEFLVEEFIKTFKLKI